MSDGKKSARERLQDLVGFDPGSRTPGSADALQQAVAEIQEERGQQAKVKAKEAIEKAMDLVASFENARKAFKKEEEKFNKELGKLMSQIERLQGKPSAGDGGSCDDGHCEVSSEDS